jgi:hypothetical protein
MFRNDSALFEKNNMLFVSVVDPGPHGSALFLVCWILNRMQVGKMSRKKTKS